MAAHLAERLQHASFKVERFETTPGKINVVASAGPVGSDGLILSGHMDVVPTDGQSWSSDPYKLTEKDGKLYGRGTCDMKGFIAAVLDVAERLDVKTLNRELLLIFTHDEEVGCLGSAALKTQLADRPVPSLTWIGEPTNFRICRLHPGHMTVRITCLGRPAHSSRPELGLNAIDIATSAMIRLKELAADLKTQHSPLPGLICPYTIVNIGCIHGGCAVNIVPERCEIHVGLRPLPGQPSAELIGRIHARLSPLIAHYQELGGNILIEGVQDTPALLTASGTQLEELLRPHADSPKTCAAPFATDGGNLAQLGTQPLVFGPGSIDVAHRPNEYLSVDALRATTQILGNVIQRRCVEELI